MTPHAAPAERPAERLRAIGLMCAAVGLFAVNDASAKWLVVGGVPTGEVVAARYGFNLLLLLVVVNPWLRPRAFRVRRPALQLARGMLLFLSTVFNFFALRYLQLSETVTIGFITPVITAVLAGFVFGQWLGRARWAAVAAGFAGVVVVTRPGLGGLHWAAGLCVASTVCYATYGIMTRMLAGQDDPDTTLLCGSAVGAFSALPFLLPEGGFAVPTLGQFLVMVLMGLAACVGHFCLILAHRHTPAQELAPFMYTQLVWMIGLGWILFGDVPVGTTILGAAIVIGSGLYLLTLERRRTA